MNWLPIVGRELRVASRKSSTFWVRLGAALAAVLVGSGCLFLTYLQRIGTAQIGSILFGVLSWMCLVAALSAGLFFTSDCLSEEKREGTLGLLFVTELRGYDVVLGKLMATSLRGLFALLALLPVLGITELMGGVTPVQYWKTSLALVNALFVSLAAGMFISSMSRDSQKALTATFLVVLLLTLGGPVADAIIAGVKRRGFQPLWSLGSPGYLVRTAGAWGRSCYWPTLLANQVLGWLMFAAASALAPHTWQERKRSGAGSSANWSYAWKYGGARRRSRLRERLLEWHPIVWLASRECWQSRALWVLAILTAAGLIVVLATHVPPEAWLVWMYLGGLFTLLIYIWTASQACRMLVEARRSGFLELLLVTPIGDRQIVRGQWRALGRLFGIPVLLLVTVHVVGSTMTQFAFQRIATQAGALTATSTTNQVPGSTNLSATSGSVTVTGRVTVGVPSGPSPSGSVPKPTPREFAMAAGAALAAAVSTAANLIALCWFGMWMGMTSKSANLATLKTLVFAQVIPSLVISFAGGVVAALVMAALSSRGGIAGPTIWVGLWPLLSAVLGAILAVGKDIGFIVWSRNRLLFALREQATRPLGVVPLAPVAYKGLQPT